MNKTSYDPLSVFQTIERIDWLDNDEKTDNASLTRETLMDWLHSGQPGKIYDFIDSASVQTLKDLHSTGDNFDGATKLKVDAILNPFNMLGQHFFSSRTALKFANLDSLLHFTKPMSSQTGESLLSAGQSLSYVVKTGVADTGIIEYMQWRKGRRATGYAWKRQNPWSHAQPDGIPDSTPLVMLPQHNNYNSAEIQNVLDFMAIQEPAGVHLAISDEHSMNELNDIREEHVKYAVLSYCSLCLAVLRENGTMIVKIMETFSPFTVGLLYLLRRCFRQMAIFKMNFSRPSSSERYLLLRERLPNVNAIVKHLISLNIQSGSERPTQLVPIDVIRADIAFERYIRKHNQKLAENQIANLYQRCQLFFMTTKMTTLPQMMSAAHQWQLRIELLRMWNIPDVDDKTYPNRYFIRITKMFEGIKPAQDVHFPDLNADPASWQYVPISEESHVSIFLFTGAERIFMLTNTNSRWQPITNIAHQMPAGTCVYGELSQEYARKSTNMQPLHKPMLHIIDVISLRFEYVLNTYTMGVRRQMLRQCIKETGSGAQIRVRHAFPINKICNDINVHFWQDANQTAMYRRIDSNIYFKISACFFYKTIGQDHISPYTFHLNAMSVPDLALFIDEQLPSVKQVNIQ